MSSEEKKEKEVTELAADKKAEQRIDELAKINFDKMFIWKDTITDGMMPFKNISGIYKEKNHKSL